VKEEKDQSINCMDACLKDIGNCIIAVVLSIIAVVFPLCKLM